MFGRIIVPLDGTQFAEAALAPACTLARAFGSQLLLVRAYGIEGLPQMTPPDVEVEAEELDCADAYLTSVTGRLKQAGYRAEHVLYIAEPNTAIVDAAVLDDADLIVMTTHPRWRTDLLDNASTTLQVLARSRVPILSWKLGARSVEGDLPDPVAEPLQFLGPESPIVVPLDGSPFSEAALRPAQELAAAFGTYLVLVRAVVRDPEAPTPGTGPSVAAQTEDQAICDAQSYLERVLANMERTGVNASVEVEVGSVVHVLDEAGRKNNAGLVVMSSHGQTATPTAFLGSNAAQVLEELTVPTLVVRP
jgi:nucleotide-binding universal stress UspA family protein